jgi:hypothetical protein
MKYVLGTVAAIVILAGVTWATDAPLQPCRATADKTVGAGPRLETAVFGDSVAWGNGLAEDRDPTPGHKLSALVADWLARTTNHQVRRIVTAHPNVEGANVYANEITKTLADFARELASDSGN